MKIVIDTNGFEYYVYEVLYPSFPDSTQVNENHAHNLGTQIYPGFVCVKLQQTTSAVRGPGIGMTLPQWLADEWLAGKVRVHIREKEPNK